LPEIFELPHGRLSKQGPRHSDTSFGGVTFILGDIVTRETRVGCQLCIEMVVEDRLEDRDIVVTTRIYETAQGESRVRIVAAGRGKRLYGMPFGSI